MDELARAACLSRSTTGPLNGALPLQLCGKVPELSAVQSWDLGKGLQIALSILLSLPFLHRHGADFPTGFFFISRKNKAKWKRRTDFTDAGISSLSILSGAGFFLSSFSPSISVCCCAVTVQ